MFKDEEALKSLLNALGESARKAFDGDYDEETWSLEPDSVDGHSAWYDWCDDCETFHKGWYLFGYEVTEGNVELVVWNCDQDGNWDVVDGAYTGTPESEDLERTYGNDAWKESYAVYMRHVADTGTDPCEEFATPDPKRNDEQWEIHVIERGSKVWITNAGKLGGSFYYDHPARLPDYVKEFLLLKEHGQKDGFMACSIDPENVKCIADFGEDLNWKCGPHRDTWVTTVTIPHYTPSMTDDEWSAVLREKANVARALMVFSKS